MGKRRVVLSIVLTAVVAAAGFPAGSQDGVESESRRLRMGLISSEGHPVTEAARYFAELVEERTEGRIAIEIIPGGALGGEVEMQDMVSDGILEMVSIGNAIPINYNEQFQLLQMPFLWDSSEEMLAFAEGEIQDRMNERYREASGIRVLASNWDQGTRNLIATEPVDEVEDLQGLKIRVPQVPAWVDVWEALGANVVILPWPEVYPALQQGVIDGAEPPLFWMNSASLQEPAKYVTFTEHIRYYNHVMINDALFSSLSPDDQRILFDAAREAGEQNNRLTYDQENSLRDELAAGGVTYLQIDRRRVAELTQPVFETWESTYGVDLLEAVMEFKETR